MFPENDQTNGSTDDAATGDRQNLDPAQKQIAENLANALDASNENGDGPRQPDQQPTKPADGTVPDNWRDMLSGGDETYRKFTDRFSTFDDYAKAQRELKTAFDAGDRAAGVQVPGADGTDEDWNKFYARLPENRRPMDPGTIEAYEAPRPEGFEVEDETVEMERAAAAHFASKGMSKAHIDEAMSYYYGLVVQTTERADAAMNKGAEDSEKVLREKWGPDFDENSKMKARGWNWLTKDHPGLDKLKLEDGSYLGNLSEFAEKMAALGRLHGESVHGTIVGELGADAQADLQTRIDEITNKAYADGGSKLYYHETTQTKLRPLYEQLHGTAPADGRAA